MINRERILCLILIVASLAIGLFIGRHDPVEHGYAGYYIGSVRAINDSYMEIDVVSENGKLQNFRESRAARLRIDSYRHYAGKFNDKLPEIGEAYVFFYEKLEEESAHALVTLMPITEPRKEGGEGVAF